MKSWIDQHSRIINTIASLIIILTTLVGFLAWALNWIRVKALYARLIDPLTINVNLSIWQGLLIIALILFSRRILKKLSVLINLGTSKNADAIGARLKTRLDYMQEFFQGINNQSIFYVNLWSDLGEDASIKPELWNRYWECERKKLDSQLTTLRNETEAAKNQRDVETLLRCFDRLCDEVRSYAAELTKFYTTFGDKETSSKFKNRFNDIVDEYNSFVRNIEEDGRYLGELLGKEIKSSVHRTDEKMLDE